MLVQQLYMLGNIPIVEVGDARIQQDVEQKGKIEDVQVKSIILQTYGILDRTVDPENPEGFDQEIQRKR